MHSVIGGSAEKRGKRETTFVVGVHCSSTLDVPTKTPSVRGDNIWDVKRMAHGLVRAVTLTISLIGISVRFIPLKFNLLFFTLSLRLSTVILCSVDG